MLSPLGIPPINNVSIILMRVCRRLPKMGFQSQGDARIILPDFLA